MLGLYLEMQMVHDLKNYYLRDLLHTHQEMIFPKRLCDEKNSLIGNIFKILMTL
jgi:hypothetical protein